MSVSRYIVTDNNRRVVSEVNNVTYIQDVQEIQVATMNTFSDGDTTPSIIGGKQWKTANTSSTIITDFDDSPGDGYQINVFIGDNYTKVAHNATKIMMPSGVSQSFRSGDIISFISVSGVWYGFNQRQA